MSRIPSPTTIDAAPDAARPLLEAVKKQPGVVPNMFRLICASPAALEGYLGLSGAVNKGSLRRRRTSASPWRSAKRTAATIAYRPTPTWGNASRSSTMRK